MPLSLIMLCKNEIVIYCRELHFPNVVRIFYAKDGFCFQNLERFECNEEEFEHSSVRI